MAPKQQPSDKNTRGRRRWRQRRGRLPPGVGEAAAAERAGPGGRVPGRDRREAERREVHAVQPAGHEEPGDRDADRRHHERSEGIDGTCVAAAAAAAAVAVSFSHTVRVPVCVCVCVCVCVWLCAGVCMFVFVVLPSHEGERYSTERDLLSTVGARKLRRSLELVWYNGRVDLIRSFFDKGCELLPLHTSARSLVSPRTNRLETRAWSLPCTCCSAAAAAANVARFPWGG